MVSKKRPVLPDRPPGKQGVQNSAGRLQHHRSRGPLPPAGKDLWKAQAVEVGGAAFQHKKLPGRIRKGPGVGGLGEDGESGGGTHPGQ